MNEIITPNITEKISNKAKKLYKEIKAFLQKIFSLIKFKNKEDLQEEFADKYHSFGRELKNEGYLNESRFYRSICDMICNAIPYPDVLKNHQKFFNDLFAVFGELLDVKINNPDEYEEKYRECRFYLGDCEFYYYTKVAVPSPQYDDKVCEEILSSFKWRS